MYVVFIVTSYWSYGELLIALEFAESIKGYGYSPYFVIPVSHEKTIINRSFPYTPLIPDNGNVNRIQLMDLELKYRPGYIILSDFINYCFCDRHYGLTVKDLEIFSGKIGTFDNFDYGLVKRKMDTYGFFAKDVSDLDIDSFGFKLVPCPIANFKEQNSCSYSKYYYSLVNDPYEYNDKIKMTLKNELGLPAGKPVILTTSAVWQGTFKLYPHVIKYVSLTNQVFNSILSRLSEYATIICIGSKGHYGECTADGAITLGNLPPEDFKRYVCASDIFISRNITSTTLAKVAVSGIPSVMIGSSLDYRKGRAPVEEQLSGFNISRDIKNAITELDICYPYRMFPVGWHSFLEPVIRDNPYTEVVDELELFEEDRCVETIRSLMEDKKTLESHKTKTAKYLAAVNDLAKPHEILALL